MDKLKHKWTYKKHIYVFFHVTKILEIGILSLGSVAHQCFMQKKRRKWQGRKKTFLEISASSSLLLIGQSWITWTPLLQIILRNRLFSLDHWHLEQTGMLIKNKERIDMVQATNVSWHNLLDKNLEFNVSLIHLYLGFPDDSDGK